MPMMTSSRRAIFIPLLFLVLTPQGRAQDTTEPARGEADVSGTFSPSGPPSEQPVRIDAGGSCVIDLKQDYDVSGALSGSLEIDYRILVYGPCEVPPVLGKYDEEWIAYGRFDVAIDGGARSGTLTYTARVRAGGDVEGRMELRGGIDGALAVSGNFAAGKLSYRGRVPRRAHAWDKGRLGLPRLN